MMLSSLQKKNTRHSYSSPYSMASALAASRSSQMIRNGANMLMVNCFYPPTKCPSKTQHFGSQKENKRLPTKTVPQNAKSLHVLFSQLFCSPFFEFSGRLRYWNEGGMLPLALIASSNGNLELHRWSQHWTTNPRLAMKSYLVVGFFWWGFLEWPTLSYNS